MLKSFALKTAAAFSPDGAKLNLLQRVRNLFKKIKEINDKNINTDEKEKQISQLLDAKEDGGSKKNIDMFGPKTYLVNEEIDEPEETKVSILNYLPQYKTTCLPSIGIEHVDDKMKETIEYLSLEENRRIVTFIATKINEKYPDMAGFTPFKYGSIKGKCDNIISTETKKKTEKDTDSDFIRKRDELAMDIINGEVRYPNYKDEDNQKEAAGDEEKEDLTAEIESLTIDPNKKASGGKRKTKRKNKKSKKSSRKKRKHRKTRKSKK